MSRFMIAIEGLSRDLVYFMNKKMPNKKLHADCQKQCGFRFATAALLLAAGELKR